MAVCEQTYSASIPVARFSFKAFLLQSCVNFYTDSGAKVWESCGEMGKGLEGPQKGHPSALSDWCAAAAGGGRGGVGTHRRGSARRRSRASAGWPG